MKIKISFFLKGFLLLFFLLLILWPQTGAQGAAYGLSLWYRIILPSLLPFLILCRLMQHYQKTLAERPLQVAFLGLLCGYPMGAKLLADLCRCKNFSHKKAAWLLSFCNQASPMFLFSYLPQMLPPLPGLSRLIFFGVYGSALLTGLCAALLSPLLSCREAEPEEEHVLTAGIEEDPPFISVLEQAMLDSVEVMIKIGGYMMLFSMAAYYLRAFPFGNEWIKGVVLGVNEMTTGIAFLSAGSFPTPVLCALCIGSAAFGGLSGFAQTQCVLQGSSLSSGRYLFWKGLQGLLAVCLTLLGYGRIVG
ncbi:MAG: hypothetical protein HFI93_09605 [Lachnospiraceae bacterium]|nr:hypothetical protein [Lachnospiraceae bacterium]